MGHLAVRARALFDSRRRRRAGRCRCSICHQPETTVIATLNPDFAEAEVDAQQINLTPYELFKPEKRAFFLEGSNQFTFASGIGSIFIPFYSRTIGLVDGTPVRIDDGIKLVGQ